MPPVRRPHGGRSDGPSNVVLSLSPDTTEGVSGHDGGCLRIRPRVSPDTTSGVSPDRTGVSPDTTEGVSGQDRGCLRTRPRVSPDRTGGVSGHDRGWSPDTTQDGPLQRGCGKSDRMPPSVDRDRLSAELDSLGRIGAYRDERTGLDGVNRLALTAADGEGRRHVVQRMRDLGLTVTVDRIGNVYGRRAGREDRLAPSSSALTSIRSPAPDASTGVSGCSVASRCSAPSRTTGSSRAGRSWSPSSRTRKGRASGPTCSVSRRHGPRLACRRLRAHRSRRRPRPRGARGDRFRGRGGREADAAACVRGVPYRARADLALARNRDWSRRRGASDLVARAHDPREVGPRRDDPDGAPGRRGCRGADQPRSCGR